LQNSTCYSVHNVVIFTRNFGNLLSNAEESQEVSIFELLKVKRHLVVNLFPEKRVLGGSKLWQRCYHVFL